MEIGVIAFFIMGFCAILFSSSFAYAQFEINEEDDFFEHYTRPTFGISHGNNEKIVDNGFKLNGQSFDITNNYHTLFPEQILKIGEVNSFEATIYAEKGLRVQEFLFGIPNVGDAHLAEMGVEVWFGSDGQISNVKVIQETKVIDENSIVATHKKTACLNKDKIDVDNVKLNEVQTDMELNCNTTTLSVRFLEFVRDKIMAVKAIDYKNRYQITYLNEGIDVSGESLNPMLTEMIPSEVRNEGLIQVKQTAKYSPYWVKDDGRLYERNSFGSFQHTNFSFERFEDDGNPYTRLHSEFGGIMAYEQKRATQLFDSSVLISELPDSFTINMPIGERITPEMEDKMLFEEYRAQKIIEESKVQTRWH
ncbi:MAG TPA: hypothetical protein VMW74_05510 [Nitrosopumilaceae archaeon]|nr:hypothetical protein [Nitrosopumilaceae archaeon]